MQRRTTVKYLFIVSGGTLVLSACDHEKGETSIKLKKLKISGDDEKIVADFFEQMTEMYTKAGFIHIKTEDSKQAPGLDIHEMGGVSMGHNPKTSMLNKWNQLHAYPNAYVNNGACMISTETQNPSLTYIALTARTVDHAVKEWKSKQG